MFTLRYGIVYLSLATGTLYSPSPAAAQTASSEWTVQHQHASTEHEPLVPSREASGTSWQPATTPMFGVHRSVGDWDVMLHGNLFAQFLYEPADPHRTGGFAKTQFSSVNWGMVMARRPAGAGRIGLRGMISLEPWTVSDCGYLNMLATGEMCEGDTIHDRQHPHDLVMELAVDYDRPVRGSMRWQVYGGLAGEPALGPGGFPHRFTAASNPVAPVSHHWLDSSHITFGLVTAGLYDRKWKAEISAFNGREPDEDRAGFDLAPFDSVSGRVSIMPSDRVVLQVSAGRLREAEDEFPPHPRSDLTRVTGSIMYHRPRSTGGSWAVLAAYGANSGEEILPETVADLVTHAALVEGSLTWGERITVFGRAELVGKPAHDLHAHEFGASVFAVGKFQVGYEHRLTNWRGIAAGVGGSASLSVVPGELESRYSGAAAPGFAVFLRVRPAGHAMSSGR